MKLRLGTRGSQLALFQARTVVDRLRRQGTDCDIVVIRTSGDRLAEAPLSEIGGKRLFVKEIEDALLSRDIDVAVHSCKDMPAVLPDGLAIGAVLGREDPRDVLVLSTHARFRPSTFEDLIGRLGQAPRVGTSSVRRIAQLKRLWPDARFAAIRGNLDTRLRKLDAAEYDVLVLAAAGMKRLGFENRISVSLPLSACIPAPGQGVIALEIAADADEVRATVAILDDEVTRAATDAERSLVARLGGGCQTPVGALAQPINDDLELHAIVASVDGQTAVQASGRSARSTAPDLGRRVADMLIAKGAAEILDEVRLMHAAVEGIQP